MMLRLRFVWGQASAISIAAFFASGSVQAQLVTPVGGTMWLEALASTSGVTASDISSDGWASIPTDLMVSARAEALSGFYYARAYGSATAQWQSADMGNITFSDYGWDYQAEGNTISEVTLCGKWCGNGSDRPDWSYTFTANADGGFRMAYDIVGQGNPSLQGWQASWSGGGCCDVALIGSDGVHIKGTFAHPVSAGQTYTYSLSNFANAYLLGTSARKASMSGVFNWSITTQGVPEPATWTVMLVGFGSIGAAMRSARRNHRVLRNAT